MDWEPVAGGTSARVGTFCPASHGILSCPAEDMRWEDEIRMDRDLGECLPECLSLMETEDLSA